MNAYKKSWHQLASAESQGQRIWTSRIIVTTNHLLKVWQLRVSREMSQIAEFRELL